MPYNSCINSACLIEQWGIQPAVTGQGAVRVNSKNCVKSMHRFTHQSIIYHNWAKCFLQSKFIHPYHFTKYILNLAYMKQFQTSCDTFRTIKVEIFLEQREVVFLSPSKICSKIISTLGGTLNVNKG